MVTYQKKMEKKAKAKTKASILIFVFIAFLTSFSLCLAQDVGWEDNFSTGTEGWYDADDNDTFGCKVMALKDDRIKVEEVAEASWGKVAKIVEGVDIEKYPIIEVKATQVDVDSAFKIGVASIDWSEYYDVIPGQNLSGVYSGNIKEKTGWSQQDKFNLIIIIEGSRKSTVFDYIRLKALK